MKRIGWIIGIGAVLASAAFALRPRDQKPEPKLRRFGGLVVLRIDSVRISEHGCVVRFAARATKPPPPEIWSGLAARILHEPDRWLRFRDTHGGAWDGALVPLGPRCGSVYLKPVLSECDGHVETEFNLHFTPGPAMVVRTGLTVGFGDDPASNGAEIEPYGGPNWRVVVAPRAAPILDP